MSEEEDESLNIKRPWKRACVIHSTPAEVSTLSQKTLDLSPVPQISPGAAQVFDKPKVRTSWHRPLRSLSTVSEPSKEFSSGSRFTVPTRRLSTITGSEESAQSRHQTTFLSGTTGGEISDPAKSHRKRQTMDVEQVSKHQERPISGASTGKSKPKRKLQKQLVDKRVRAWELRQLINIEEATKHELIVEEVQSWK